MFRRPANATQLRLTSLLVVCIARVAAGRLVGQSALIAAQTLLAMHLQRVGADPLFHVVPC